MTSLSTHRERWEACARCDIHSFTSCKILYRGTTHCHILIVGEAPGDVELALERPFVGPTGKYLDGLIQKIRRELKASGVMIGFTNAIACGPYHTDNLKLRTPTTEEIENCYPRLQECIEAVSPKVIIALGAAAKKAMQYIDTDIPIEYAIHPAAILRQGPRGTLDEARLKSVLKYAFNQVIDG